MVDDLPLFPCPDTQPPAERRSQGLEFLVAEWDKTSGHALLEDQVEVAGSLCNLREFGLVAPEEGDHDLAGLKAACGLCPFACGEGLSHRICGGEFQQVVIAVPRRLDVKRDHVHQPFFYEFLDHAGEDPVCVQPYGEPHSAGSGGKVGERLSLHGGFATGEDNGTCNHA